MAKVALGLWGVYYVLTLGVRVALHLRRTGWTGLALMRSKPGTAAWLGELTDVGGNGDRRCLADPGRDRRCEADPALDAPAVGVVGAALFVLGLAGIVASRRAMGESWRIGIEPDARTEQVTHGPFTLVRDPVFSALVAVLAGSALMAPTALGFIALAAIILSVELQARLAEEPHLLRLHGEAYASYVRRTGRFLPGVGRMRGQGR
jgi:hypothetical protein